MYAPVHLLLKRVLLLIAISLMFLEILLNTHVLVATTWWELDSEHVRLVVTGQEVLQPVRQV